MASPEPHGVEDGVVVERQRLAAPLRYHEHRVAELDQSRYGRTPAASGLTAGSAQ